MYCPCALKWNLCPVSKHCPYPRDSLWDWKPLTFVVQQAGKQVQAINSLLMVMALLQQGVSWKESLMAETIFPPYVHIFLILWQYREIQVVPRQITTKVVSKRKVWQERNFPKHYTKIYLRDGSSHSATRVQSFYSKFYYFLTVVTLSFILTCTCAYSCA